jgi:hypothetical protein
MSAAAVIDVHTKPVVKPIARVQSTLGSSENLRGVAILNLCGVHKRARAAVADRKEMRRVNSLIRKLGELEL